MPAKTFRLRHAVLALTLLTTACGGSDEDETTTPTPSPTPSATQSTLADRIAAAETSGQLPKLDRSGDLAGPDLNGNGVRDDIDGYISAQPYTPAQKASLTQLAKASQAALTADLSNRASMDAVRLADARAVRCAFLQFPAAADPSLAASVSTDIEKLTTNTKARLLAYLAFEKTSDGTVLPSPEGNTCE